MERKVFREMKYIRTKDELGILIEPTDNEELQKLKVGVNDMIFSTWYGNNRDNIVKQANTIEELCDEKVGTFKDGSKPYIYKKMSWVDLKKDWTQYHNNLYGAIWTDKGLIYVAKLNEKGEMELL